MTRLVGRDPELATLSRAVVEASAGSGRMMLLSGEAGIGKSRLAAQTLEVARAGGFAAMSGRAHALHAGLAYAPIVEAIRPHVAVLTDYEGLADLGRLVADPRLPAAPPLGDPELERTRMFEAVSALVRRLAPVVLFVDDLHWADRGTIELVHYLGQAARGSRVLVLAAYRPGDTLNDLVVAIRRDNPGDELGLEPLADDAVAELARDLLGAEPEPDLLRGVTSRAKGVPLFVTALLQGREVGGPLPMIVRDVVLGRLRQLDEPERRLMEIAAVAGATGTAEVLRGVWAAPGFQRTVRKLRDEGLLAEQSDGGTVTYRVAHPLYAEAAYTELTLGERRGLHAELAAAIDKYTPDDVLALAPHYREAGDLVDGDRVAEVMTEAGWRALRVHAAEEAVQYLTAATATAKPALLPTLLDGLGRAHQGAGRLDDAAAAWNEAVTLAERLGDTRVLRLLRPRLALVESERGNAHLAEEHSLAGIRAAGHDTPEAAVLHILFTIRQGDAEQMKAAVIRLVAWGEKDPSPAAQTAGHGGRALLALLHNDFAAARAETREALAHGVLVEEESPIYAQSARRMLIGLSVLAGDVPASLDHARIGHGERAEFELPSARCSGQYGLATARYLAGDVAGALEEIELGVGVARRAGLPRSLTRMLLCRAFLLSEQGRVGEAEACVAEAKQSPLSPDRSVTPLAELAETALAVHSGHPAQAPGFSSLALFNEQLVACVGLLFGGLAALAADARPQVGEACARLRELGRTAPFLDALADRLDGLRTREPEPLRAASERLEAMGALLLAAQARLEWAEFTRDREAIAHCLAVFERAGVTPWIDRARRLARAAGLRLAPPRRGGVLSNRESQVAGLVGEGLANAEIAARLFLSERTVETHLRNSYAKLGLTSRIALARWVAEQ